jgi:3-oxoacyl-[acyl-carrier-protein] synthase-3
VYGLSIAEKYVSAGAARHVLVIGVELLSRIIDWKDRTTCVLFGDGAGAVVIGPSERDGRGIVSTHLFTDGALVPILQIPGGGTREPFDQNVLDSRRHYVQMSGPEVMKAAVRYLAASAKTALETNGLTTDSLDWVVAHQANIRIIQAMAQRVGISLDKFYLTISKYGNTSSATVPIALSEMDEKGLLLPGQTILLCALGAGISWGSAIVRW